MRKWERLAPRSVNFSHLIAYTILFMAWFNSINMFLARSMERINEIGVKKMLGSTRIHLVVQFFAESMVINPSSFTLRFFHSYSHSSPLRVGWAKTCRVFSLTRFHLSPGVYGMFVGSALAALYPAARLSSYKPIEVLGRKFQSTKQGVFVNRD